ncbi:MAG: hypothetical protein KBI43_04520, partial [Kiritimatiellae bacterium]|nr:hypothetical protein [Kiritimatiellia bacterium]
QPPQENANVVMMSAAVVPAAELKKKMPLAKTLSTQRGAVAGGRLKEEQPETSTQASQSPQENANVVMMSAAVVPAAGLRKMMTLAKTPSAPRQMMLCGVGCFCSRPR